MRNQEHMRGQGGLILPILLLAALLSLLVPAERACALDPEADAGIQVQMSGGPGYHTPLAGKKTSGTVMGNTVEIPGYDRAHLNAVTLGGSVLFPRQGTTGGLPVAALYFRHYWENSRTRDVIAIFVNELEYDRGLAGPLELVGHFENYTLPGDITEIRDNKEIDATEVTWGTLIGSLGPGVRFKVPPFELDNDFRVQLLGRIGYLYAEGSHMTGPGVVVPPNTLLYGARLRGRYDAMRRNILELPHHGFAVGFDVDYMRRENWRSLAPQPSGSINHDYLQVKGYALTASGIPGQSERDRVMLYLNAGKITEANADRFNAFLINGGPFPSESDDLTRPWYAGQLHDDVRATTYATGSLAYRRELTFFLYLTLAGSYIWGDRATVRGLDQVVFHDKTGAAGTVQLDSAFLWNSQLSLNYSWESGFIRDGRSGSGVTLFWNKIF